MTARRQPDFSPWIIRRVPMWRRGASVVVISLVVLCVVAAITTVATLMPAVPDTAISGLGE